MPRLLFVAIQDLSIPDDSLYPCSSNQNSLCKTDTKTSQERLPNSLTRILRKSNLLSSQKWLLELSCLAPFSILPASPSKCWTEPNSMQLNWSLALRKISHSNFQISNDNVLPKTLSKLLCLLTLAIQGFPFNSILDLTGVSIHPCFVMCLAITVRSPLILGYLNLCSRKQRRKKTNKTPKPHHSLFPLAGNVLLDLVRNKSILLNNRNKHNDWPRAIHGTSWETSHNACSWELS